MEPASLGASMDASALGYRPQPERRIPLITSVNIIPTKSAAELTAAGRSDEDDRAVWPILYNISDGQSDRSAGIARKLAAKPVFKTQFETQK